MNLYKITIQISKIKEYVQNSCYLLKYFSIFWSFFLKTFKKLHTKLMIKTMVSYCNNLIVTIINSRFQVFSDFFKEKNKNQLLKKADYDSVNRSVLSIFSRRFSA